MPRVNVEFEHKYNVGDIVKAEFQGKIWEFEVTSAFAFEIKNGFFAVAYKLFNEDVAEIMEDDDFYDGTKLLIIEEILEIMQTCKLGMLTIEARSYLNDLIIEARQKLISSN